MPSRESHLKKFDKRIAKGEEKIQEIEEFLGVLKSQLQLLRDSREELLDKGVLKQGPFNALRRMASKRERGDINKQLSYIGKTFEAVWTMSGSAREDLAKVARRNELNQRFTVGSLVEYDPDAIDKYDRKLFTREGEEKGGAHIWYKRVYTYESASGSTINIGTGAVQSYRWRRQVELELKKGDHAIVIDTKTSSMYVQIQLGNHRYWIKRDGLIVAQN